MTVADHGPSILDKFAPRLFEPFVKGEGSASTASGLPIVAVVAYSYGGWRPQTERAAAPFSDRGFCFRTGSQAWR